MNNFFLKHKLLYLGNKICSKTFAVFKKWENIFLNLGGGSFEGALKGLILFCAAQAKPNQIRKNVFF